MPEATQVLDMLARQYGASYELVLDGADAALTTLWQQLGATAVGQPDVWATAAGPLIDGAQQAAAANAAGWLEVQVGAMGADLPLATSTVLDPPTAVLRSPVVRARTLLGQGLAPLDAVNRVATYVSRLTATTVRAAEQQGRAQAARQLAPAIASVQRSASSRWVRVPDARACGWCRVVADQAYSEATVSGRWHAYCRCAWRLATPADMDRLGQYSRGSRWQDIIGQPAVSDAEPAPA